MVGGGGGVMVFWGCVCGFGEGAYGFFGGGVYGFRGGGGGVYGFAEAFVLVGKVFLAFVGKAFMVLGGGR